MNSDDLNVILYFAYIALVAGLYLYLSTAGKPNRKISVPVNDPSPFGFFISKKAVLSLDQEISPDVCVLTGQPATERHEVWALNFMTIDRIYISLPFSAEGWDAYLKRRPISMLVLEKGASIFNFWFLRYFWKPFCVLVLFPILGAIDLCLKKRLLIRIAAKGISSIREVVVKIRELQGVELHQ